MFSDEIVDKVYNFFLNKIESRFVVWRFSNMEIVFF